jgi:hypothetical protein
VRSPIFGQLESSLAEYLAEISLRARYGDDRAVAAMARTELPKLVEAVRAVLDEHAPDQFGRCAHCRPGRFSRTPAPCRAYLTAHLCLVSADDDPSPAETTTPLHRPVTLTRHSPRRDVIRVSG